MQIEIYHGYILVLPYSGAELLPQIFSALHPGYVQLDRALDHADRSVGFLGPCKVTPVYFHIVNHFGYLINRYLVVHLIKPKLISRIIT